MNNFCIVYIDNVLIFSKSRAEHNKHIKKVLQKLQEVGLQVDICKSKFGIEKTKFLGLIISKDRIEIDLDKIKVILE